MTTPLPVITSIGGVNPAGRLSFDYAYRRLVIEALDEQAKSETYTSLAALMGLEMGLDTSDDPTTRSYIDAHTLVRRIENFDPNDIYWQRALRLSPSTIGGTNGGANGRIEFDISRRQLPDAIPPSWQVSDIDDRNVHVVLTEPMEVMLPDARKSKVTSAGQLPTGFDPGKTYPSRSHPRGLELTVYAASDALMASGIDIDTLKAHITPDQLAVYAGTAMSQLGPEGYGGLLQNPLIGKRPSSKHCTFGLPEMPGDFVNAYLLGSFGETAGIIGACATFLYNVKRAIDEIKSGDKRVVLVGNSEAPILPEIIEGYRTMGALAEDEALMALDGSSTVDNRRACRPFSDNCGFTVAEGSAWILLMDDALALELGANVHGSIGGVFVNADGYKKSISGPGVGNYITVAKAMAAAKAIVGEKALRERTYMQAHGTGTPQNRVTESHILNELAKHFGIDRWLVGAVKSYVGHTMAPAGGDALSAILGAWKYGVIPGITTIDHLADDVFASNLHLPFEHVKAAPDDYVGAFINSKGFGGNNATGFFMSPTQTQEMLAKRHGTSAINAYRDRNADVQDKAIAYDAATLAGETSPIYKFGEGVLEGTDLTFNEDSIAIPGFEKPVSLNLSNIYGDMTD